MKLTSAVPIFHSFPVPESERLEAPGIARVNPLLGHSQSTQQQNMGSALNTWRSLIFPSQASPL